MPCGVQQFIYYMDVMHRTQINPTSKEPIHGPHHKQRSTHLFIFTVVPPQLLDVDHGVDTAPLVNSPHGCDALVLSVRAHRLTVEQRRELEPQLKSVSIHLNDDEGINR